MSQNFSISESAARRITQLLSSGEAQGSMLRISVSGGGCSGFQYSFLFDDTILTDDKVFENNSAKVVIDEISLGLLQESILDYIEDMVASTFVIKNPNAASSCGCGNSFSI
ncbi:MAG: iron-sulfur cluster insertion protein ErpA [Candidatus Paracaedibacteraceae bacterium]|nr:iron-sulfur cluster insertion protein ErpA [Candidatus Paracaedibacteraceae bacterium]